MLLFHAAALAVRTRYTGLFQLPLQRLDPTGSLCLSLIEWKEFYDNKESKSLKVKFYVCSKKACGKEKVLKHNND